MGGSKTRLFVVAALLLTAAPAWSQNPVPPSVAVYERATSDSTITIEHVFDLGEQAAQDLMRGSLSNFSGEEIIALLKQMPGYMFSNREALFALPRVAFFADLSRRRGRPQDIAFFETLAVDSPDGEYMPAYIQRTTHVQGCRLLDGTFSRVDAAWRRYSLAYPQFYVRYVAQRLDDIERRISDSVAAKHVCACGEQPEAEQDLTTLAKLGPQESMGRSAATLLRGLRDHSVEFEAQCRPN